MTSDESGFRLLLAEGRALEALLGAQLQQARAERGLSVESVAERLLLSTCQVRALETADPTPFHNPIFLTRALQKYAHLVDVNSASWTEPAPAAQDTSARGTDALRLTLATLPTRWRLLNHHRRHQALVIIVSVAAMLLLGACALWGTAAVLARP